MFIIRHAQSVFNETFSVTGRDPGVRDAPLTAQGVAQARAAGRLLATKGITHICSSPYTRALQTAHYMNETLNLAISAHPLIGERRLYSCDIGTELSQLRQDWPAVDFAAVEQESWWPQHEETEQSIRHRAAAFAASPPRENWLYVSHWHFILTLTGHDMENAQHAWRDGGDSGRYHKGGYPPCPHPPRHTSGV